MISALRLLRAIGLFSNVDSGTYHPFDRLTLIYSENGRGKTTIAAVLRSLSTGDVNAINERRSIGGTSEPQAVIAMDDGAIVVFRDGAWGATRQEVMVFDDEFVDQNIYSGLGVDPEHRQHLHELVIGTQAVTLNVQLAGLVEQVEQHNRELRVRSAAVPPALRLGLSLDDYCGLPSVPEVDAKIGETERALAIAQEAQAVSQRAALAPLDVTAFDAGRINELLDDTLGTAADAVPAAVTEHLRSLGPSGEQWAERGMRMLREHAAQELYCPFCAQDLANSPVADAYETLFSDAYRSLTQRLTTWLEGVDRRHGGDAIATFERNFRQLVEAASFWGAFIQIPPLELDTELIGQLRSAARELVRDALTQKIRDPLVRGRLSGAAEEAIARYNAALEQVASINERVRETNAQIAVAKERATVANAAELRSTLVRLRAIKSRYETPISEACTAYLAEREAKTRTEGQRDEVRRQLDAMRTTVFPGYQESTNYYLQRLHAGFRLDSITPVNTRGGPSVTYNVLIEERPVAVPGLAGQGQPSFRTALSAGDRTTLALAFFFALVEHTPRLDSRVVVVDDPVSSLDDQRSWATAQEIRTLAGRVAQLIVLSHNKPFLCNLWDLTERQDRAALQIVRAAQGSDLDSWDVNRASLGEHDRRDERFRAFVDRAAGVALDLARDLRPHLEAYVRHAHPEEFPPGSLLGPFLQVCRDRLGTPREVLGQARMTELQELLDFSNRFHHDTNPRAATEQVTDTELRAMIRRVRGFVAL